MTAVRLMEFAAIALGGACLCGCGSGASGSQGTSSVPTPAVSLSPTSMSFSANSGSQAAAQTLTVTNIGNASLALGSVTVSGTNASSFSINNFCDNTLGAGSNCSIGVSFAPASPGSYSATLSIADNASTSPQTVALSGNSVTATGAAESLTVDVGTILNDVERRPLGINTMWYNDNDANRAQGSTALNTALTQMGVHYLRFGYDTIWTDGDHQVLARYGEDDYPSDYAPITVQPPNPTNFTNTPYTFNQFMSSCRAIGCIPSIILDEQEWYESAPCPVTTSGPTRDQLIAATTAEVTYAQSLNYSMPFYWEIGNEPFNAYGGCNGNAFTAAQYAADVLSWSAAVKSVNPNALVGAACQTESWCSSILASAADNIDFLVFHEYPAYQTFSQYQSNTDMTADINGMEAAIGSLDSADQSRMKIAITEINSMNFSSTAAWQDLNDLGHALANFELLYQYAAKRTNVSYMQVWATRWVGNTETNPYYQGALLGNNNSLTPSAQALQLLIANMNNKIVSASASADNMVHSYASYDQYKGNLAIAVVNRDSVVHPINLQIDNYTPSSSQVASEVFTGSNFLDWNTTLTQGSSLQINGGLISTTVEPLSITILNLSGMPEQGLNSVLNAGFEASPASLLQWKITGTAALTPDARTGIQAVILSDGACIAQTVPVVPGVSYTFSGFGMTSTSAATLGITYAGGSQSLSFNADAFASASTSVTFPSGVTSATVQACAPASGSATFDDIFLGSPMATEK